MLPARLLEQTLSELEKSRSARIKRCNDALSALYQKYPKLRELNTETAKNKRLAITTKLSGEDPSGYLKAAGLAQDQYDKELRSTLKKENMDPASIEFWPLCPLCSDTGYTGREHKKYCSCVINAVTSLMAKDSGAIEGATFENYDASVFPDDVPSFDKNMSQREYMRRLKTTALKWCADFPDNKRRQMLFIGPPGVGKSYLLNCIAHSIIARGHTVMLTTASAVNEAGLSLINGEPSLVNMLRQVELLIIDDLGAEPMIRNVTIENLYSIIEHRALGNRHTILSSNLMLPEMHRQYGERILSRLTRRDITLIYNLSGSDVRKSQG